jgi:hypothetical protein
MASIKDKAQESEKEESGEKESKIRTQYVIETINGIYTIKRPVGVVGAKHFSILTKCVPSTRDEDGNVILSPADNERMSAAFEQWSTMVLPKIVIDGPFTGDMIPGEDQYALFLAMFNVMNFGVGPNRDPFRIL